MADALSMWGGYPMLGEEPEHCALSMYSVLESLWKARTELAKLKGTEAADEIERLRTAVFAAATAAGRERLAAQNARHIALEEAAAVCDGLQSGPQCATAIRALSAVEKGTET